MSERKPKSPIMSGRNTALLLAVVPLATGIYQEGQQQRQRYAERDQARKEAEATRQANEADADSKAASALQDVLLKTDDSFCSRIYLAASLLSTQSVSKRTRTVLIAALQIPGADRDKPAVCSCDNGEGSKQWFDDFAAMLPEDKGDRLDRLNQLARLTESSCGTEELSKPDLLQQLASVKAERDVLSEQLKQASRPVGSVASAPSPIVAAPPPPIAEAPAAACVIAAPGERRRVRVFIQVPDEAARSDASALHQALNAQGQFKSPQIETVGASRSPSQLEVRYTYPTDLAAAEIVSTALAEQAGCGARGQPTKLVYMGHFQGKTDKGVIEVWWPKPTQS